MIIASSGRTRGKKLAQTNPDISAESDAGHKNKL